MPTCMVINMQENTSPLWCWRRQSFKINQKSDASPSGLYNQTNKMRSSILYSFIHPPTHPLIYLLLYMYAFLFIHPLIYSHLSIYLIYSFFQLFIHSFTKRNIYTYDIYTYFSWIKQCIVTSLILLQRISKNVWTGIGHTSSSTDVRHWRSKVHLSGFTKIIAGFGTEE